MKLRTLAALSLVIALPISAQTPPISAVAAPATDSARIAAARPVIDSLWPLGTYKRIMDATMNGVMKGTMDKMFDMRASDVAGMGGATKDHAAQLGNGTLSEMAQQRDPYFKQRMDITMKVMMDGMTDLMTKLEPQVREGLVRAYARRFTVGQLGELNAFFKTPTGNIYAAQSMTLMTDPELMKEIQGFMPELFKAMPAIIEKAKAATASLPPPPKPSAN